MPAIAYDILNVNLRLLSTLGLPPRNKYRGDVTFTTRSGEYLFATTRSNHFDVTGYITAFKLGPSGEIERQLFINPTSTTTNTADASKATEEPDENAAAAATPFVGGLFAAGLVAAAML